jgi:uncharacterized membrane protein YeaQ/YmgE (transglycosylase-associated protein family)
MTARPVRTMIDVSSRRVSGDGRGSAYGIPMINYKSKKEMGMDAQTLIIWLVVGAVAGWLAGVIVRGFGFGVVGNIIVGIVGAFLAGWLLPQLGLNLGVTGIAGAILYALIGAIILLLIIGLIRRAA